MSNPETEAALQRAQRLHSAGKYADAEAAYHQILQLQPTNAGAAHMLGLLLFQQGRHQEGLSLLKQSVEAVPNQAPMHFNYGSALLAASDFSGAVAELRRALELQPNYPEAMGNLSVALSKQGNFKDAAVVARLVIAQQPRSPEAYWNLSMALRGQGDQACARGDLAGAEDFYKQSIKLNSLNLEAQLGLAKTYAAMGDATRAEDAFVKAHTMKQDSDEVCFSIGQWLDKMHRREEAVEWFQRAIALNPNRTDAYVDLAAILGEIGRNSEALPLARRALELEPDNIAAATTLGAILSLSGLHDEGSQVLTDLLQRYGASPTLAEGVRKNLGLAMNNLLMLRHYAEGYDPQKVFDEHKKFGEQFDRPASTPPDVDRNPNRKLRVGYVSGDFRAHSVAFFLEPILDHHDRSTFDIYLYPTATYRDAVAQRFREKGFPWRSIDAVPDVNAFSMIREDKIDILVDLSGHTSYSRLPLFGMKPAPVQVSYLGYPDTTGLSTIDYKITDAVADPPAMTEQWYTEKLWRLPKTAWCYRAFPDAPPVAPPPSETNGFTTFGCFNTARKISRTSVALWARILAAVDNSKLILKSREFDDQATRERLHRFLIAQGIASERFELRPRNISMADHLATYSEIDIALDPYPYHGTTTTCDAIYMGVPVITLAGQVHLSRVGASILTNVGLADLIAKTPDEYVDFAVKLSADRNRLRALRSELRQRIQQSPLCDEAGFTRDLEQAYRQMWEEKILNR